jgi:phosphoglycolate phosphatase-like HAD superfamily hydrolase
MKNPFSSSIEWNKIKNICFDMDGTLYDEFDFIKQVYQFINENLINNKDIENFMINRWLEKGSSYPEIFKETYEKIGHPVTNEKDFVQNCLNIYRNFNPNLEMSFRTKRYLDFFNENFNLFLISDGHGQLQKNKFNSLKLNNYFKINNTVFTGDHDFEFHKPNIKSISLLDINPEFSVYIGDRDIDKKFAKKTNMQFIKVYNMFEVL